MMPAEEPSLTLEAIRENTKRSGYFQLLDMHVENAHDGLGEVRVKVNARLMHPQQIVHGGVIFTLATFHISASKYP